MTLTPIEQYGRRFVKRDDAAAVLSVGGASGSKVRQYLAMSAASPPGTPMVVGCSAYSAQQIYVAASAEFCNVRGVVVVPARKSRTLATRWAADHGAEIVEVRPGYPAVYRKRAKEVAKTLGGCVRWNVKSALCDAMEQVQNIPDAVRRIVVPTGSGLTAAGVMAGVTRYLGSRVSVLAVAVSGMASVDGIRGLASQAMPDGTSCSCRLEFLRHPAKYEQFTDATLPDGSRLDPYYSAKAKEYVGAGDCLWVSGCRPVEAMPPQFRAV